MRASWPQAKAEPKRSPTVTTIAMTNQSAVSSFSRIDTSFAGRLLYSKEQGYV